MSRSLTSKAKKKLPDLDSNQETSAPEADVLPITPSGKQTNDKYFFETLLDFTKTYFLNQYQILLFGKIDNKEIKC